MNKLSKITLKQIAIALTSITLILPSLLYGGFCLRRPPRIYKEQKLFPGIFYKRIVRSQPRTLIIHIVTIDLTAPGVRLLVTPGEQAPDLMESNAQTTSEFLTKYRLQLAINGNYFHPFHDRGPFDYYPHKGDRVNLNGEAISNGKSYSPPDRGWPVLCFSADKRAQIYDLSCPVGTVQGLAGSDLMLERGKPVALKNNLDQNELEARTAVGIDERGSQLWLVLVDGRQPFYSEGVTVAELTEIVKELGAYTALNLDGGGSTTLAIADDLNKPQLLNSPTNSGIPMYERPIANQLGIYAKP